tara:strand:+ start:211 stop:435 length:225 start_codon:yes stop_codon:yes gene_type:complete
MRVKLKIFISILILFFSFEGPEIKSHDTNNGGCKDHCFYIINRKSNEAKIKVFKNKKKLIKENNSCVNNYLCRG